MTPQQVERVKAILDEALDLAPDDRRDFVRDAAGDDEVVRKRVEKLLDLETSDSDFLESTLTIAGPISDIKLPEHLPANLDDATGQEVGGYRIVRRIGAGGAGTVYEAVQDQPHRTIALKLLSSGDLSDTLVRRFQRESEVLAHLHHPGIAHVYDAGVHDTGTLRMPYIAMELIREGRTIVTYANENQLAVGQRLELMIQACKAVQHAHDRGIVHRDLKPANILINAEGQPKVIDFGVARVLSRDDQPDVTMHTGAGDIIGTLPYMAPEQCGGNVTAVDQRVDVYALGVVLFEILSGRLPLLLAGLSLDDAIRAIRHQPAGRLKRIAPALDSDLDAITAKALRKSPDNRYQSVAAFAADLQRHLDRRPVTARPPSMWYTSQLFAKRHRVGVMIGSIAAVLLLFATVFSVGFGLKANEAARAEAHQRRVAERVSEYLIDIMVLPNPHVSGSDVTVLEMLDNVAATLDQTPDEMPEVEAAVRAAIGDTYLNLNRFEQASQQLSKAVAIMDEHDFDGRELVSTLNSLGLSYTMQDRNEESEAAHRRAVELARQLPSDSDIDMAVYLTNLSQPLINTGKLDEAEEILLEMIDHQTRKVGPNHVYVIANLRKLSDVYQRNDDYPKAEALLRDLVERVRENMEPSHPVTAATIGDLGQNLFHQKKYAEAESLYRERWDLILQVRTPGGQDWTYALEDYLDLLIETERFDDAIALLKDAIASIEQRFGEDSDKTKPWRERLAELQRRASVASSE